MLKEKMYPYFYILPAILFVCLIVVFPNIYSVYLSFTNYSLYHFNNPDFVGFKNYVKILGSQEVKTFLSVFWWTVVWSLVSVLGQFVIGLALAMVLNRPGLQFRNFYRTLLIIPWAIPSFITVLMWSGLLNTQFGAINNMFDHIPFLMTFIQGAVSVLNWFIGGFNTLFSGLGLHLQTFVVDQQNRIPWLTNPAWAKVAVLMVNLWLGFPYMMSVSLGALQSIPSELYEASSLDGASKKRQFMTITLPLLRSSMLPVLITSFSFSFNNFVGIYLLTGGGPAVSGSVAGATDILVSYTYKLAFSMSQYGLACAYAVLIFILIGSLSAANFKFTGAFKED